MEKLNLCKLTPLGRMPLNQKIYESLKHLILNGDIPPGAKLNESQVAQQMDTSTTPVREAFRQLAAEGLIKIEPWKGAVVQEYSTDEIQEVFQCRQVLETLALDLTISRLEKLSTREEIFRQMEEDIALSEGEDAFSGFVGRNSGIHNFWIRGSGNRRLMSLMESLNDVLIHDRNFSAMDEQRRREIVDEHREIFQAVRLLNREEARAALIRHIEKGYQYSLKIRRIEEERQTKCPMMK